MLDKTITSALLNLRAQIIRGKSDGLEHVEALLVARGVDPAAQHVPRKANAAFRHSELRQIIFAALREGPQSSRAIADRVQASSLHLTTFRARHKVHRAIWKMKDMGLVAKDGALLYLLAELTDKRYQLQSALMAKQ